MGIFSDKIQIRSIAANVIVKFVFIYCLGGKERQSGLQMFMTFPNSILAVCVDCLLFQFLQFRLLNNTDFCYFFLAVFKVNMLSEAVTKWIT